ncbi:MAG: hypothetical protein ACRCXT_10445 [Paraclostridium sp.]
MKLNKRIAVVLGLTVITAGLIVGCGSKEVVDQPIGLKEYLVGGNISENSKVVVNNSDVYGRQEDTVYIIPPGRYKVDLMLNESVGKVGNMEIESTELTEINEDGSTYDLFESRETIYFDSINEEVKTQEIEVKENEQIDVNGNIVIKLTEIK